MGAAANGHDGPAERLHAVSLAYLEFAAQRPHHYRVLFQRRHSSSVNLSGTSTPNTDVRAMVGADAFGVLLDATIDCIDSGASRATDPVDTANQIWVGLHGQATLLVNMPWHPWPADRRHFARTILTHLAQLVPGS